MSDMEAEGRPALPRVMFDCNDGSHEGGWTLCFDQSIRDLEAVVDLKDGTRVLLYMIDDLEVEAELKFDKKLGCWLGFPTAPYRHLDSR